jgi:ubiquinone/menaquinone biosynthesis C-methylase UbiE
MDTTSTRMAVKRALIGQFGNPHGMAGNLAGWVMAYRTSNRRRNRWVAALLDVQPGDRILEIGFGPGRAVAELSRLVGPSGHVYGVDRSPVMLRHATRRNAAAVRAGQVTLLHGAVERLPPEAGGPFDAILAVNSLGFWTEPVERLQELRRRLAPGGRIALASQPRGGATTTGSSLAPMLEAAGFGQLRTEILELDPPVVCVLARSG